MNSIFVKESKQGYFVDESMHVTFVDYMHILYLHCYSYCCIVMHNHFTG